jgi:hypothetical protein
MYGPLTLRELPQHTKSASTEGTTWELGGDILQAFDVLGTPVSAVPEPSTALLLVTGLVGLLALARKSI